MSLQRKENNLRKAQARFDKVSRRSKLFQIDFRREANSRGRFHTRAYIVRGEKMHHGGRGIIHKVANAKYRITGDKPSVTRTIKSWQPKTMKGKLFKANARAVNFTMNRKAIRDLAAKELGLKTAKYFYAKSLEELKEAAKEIGFPCVVKPLMSSSGKGQSLVKSADELEQAWHYGCEGSRGDIKELIIEEFIKFDSEITLLTVTQKNGPTLFCPPIGHVQKGGDYRESFQPAHIDPEHLKEAQRMADKVTAALTGAGIWGVEFFLSHENGVYFSELSPRPHDTGMVTLAGTQNLNEFELHLRAVLGLPIPEITQERIGASAVILSPIASKEAPRYRGEEEVCKETNTYLRIFGKPYTKLNRRMGVVVCYAPNGSDLDALRDKCKAVAAKVEVY